MKTAVIWLWTQLHNHSLYEEANDRIPASDSGYVMAGWTAYGLWPDTSGVYVVKTNANGVPDWTLIQHHLRGAIASDLRQAPRCGQGDGVVAPVFPLNL